MKTIYLFLFQPKLYSVALAVSKFKEEMADRMGVIRGEYQCHTDLTENTDKCGLD